jgi:WD40 repeat protein
LQRELQHEARVNRVVFSSDSSHLLTASGDTDSANPASQGETLVYDVLASPETPVQLPNDYPVACAASNQDASIIAVGATDGSVALYRRKAGGATSEYSPKNLWAHTSAVTDIAFNPDGSRLVSTSVDRTAVIWNARSGRQVATLRGHTATIQRAAYRPDGMLIATAGYDGAVRLWDAGTGDSVAVLEGHLAPVSSITFGRDGSRLLTAGRDGSIRVWDASRGAQLQERVQGSRFAGLLSAGASPDGSLFVTAGADGIARVWDGDWKPLNEPIQHSGPVLGVAFSPDSRLVATAGGDGLVHVREARTGSPVCAPLQHPGPVTGVAFDPKQGQYILTACRDNQMRVWVVEAGKERLSVPGNTERVNPRMFSPDAATIVVPSAGVIGFRSAQGAARIWDTKRGGSLGVLRWGSGPVADATFSQAGDRIALAHPGASEATVWHWDGSQYVHDRTFKTATGPIRVAFDRDASRVATESEDGVGTIWDVRAERPSHSYFGLVGPTPIIGFGSAGGKFLGDSGIGVGQVFDLDAGSSPSLVGGRRSMLHAALLRDSDNSAFAVEHGGTLVRWNTLSGMPTVVSSQTQHFVVTAAAFSANGQFVVIAGGKGDIVVQDTDGKKPPVIIRYTGFVSRAAVNSGGRQLALAGMDFKVRLLDTSMLTQVRSVLSQVEFAASPSRVMTLAHDDHVNSIEFNHDGTRLLTSEGDVSPVRLGARATARIYSLDRGGSEGSASPEPIRVLNWPEDEASASNQDTADDVARGANVAIYSHSGKYILTAVGDGRLPAGSGRAMLWDAAGGDRPIGIYARHAEPILDAAFSPRDDRIVTTSADNSALVWDIADGGAAQGKVLSTLRGHTGNVDAASFSPDERFVLTVSKEDGSARVWEAASGDLIYTLRGLVSDFYRQELTHFGGIRRPLDDVNTAEWLQRGEGILTANGDGFARVYSCQECGELQALLTLAKQRISQKAPIK